MPNSSRGSRHPKSTFNPSRHTLAVECVTGDIVTTAMHDNVRGASVAGIDQPITLRGAGIVLANDMHSWEVDVAQCADASG